MSNERVLKEQQHKLYNERVQSVQNGIVPGKAFMPDSMFKSIREKPESDFKFDFK